MKSTIVPSPGSRAADERNGAVDAETVLDNVVELDRLLDDTSRREVDALPVLELSKHMRVRPPSSSSTPPAEAGVVDGDRSRTTE